MKIPKCFSDYSFLDEGEREFMKCASCGYLLLCKGMRQCPGEFCAWDKECLRCGVADECQKETYRDCMPECFGAYDHRNARRVCRFCVISPACQDASLCPGGFCDCFACKHCENAGECKADSAAERYDAIEEGGARD